MSDTNREILFRGKRVDNGEWIYGDLRHISDFNGGYYPCIIDNSNGRNNNVSGVPVNLQTIGQYTGLADKNGTKIFEGDIVEAYKFGEKKHVEIITFKNGCFWFGNWSFTEFIDKFRMYKVIGNIYDKPELLEANKHETEEN